MAETTHSLIIDASTSTKSAEEETNTDTLIRFLLPDSHSRGVIIRSTEIFKTANRIHGLNGRLNDDLNSSFAQLFDQTLLASILLLSISKGGTRQVLQLNGSPTAPLKKVLSEARQGQVRGYIDWADEHTILHQHDNVNLSSWLGSPIRLSTVRDLGFGQPYVSTIEHPSDFLADHLIHYLHQSVQIKADIILQGDLAIMIEAMPGCDDEHWFQSVETMAKIPNSALQDETPETLLRYFDSLNIKQVGTDSYAYHCDCSPEKMLQALRTLPADQLAELADEAGNITTSCQYCKAHHVINLTHEHNLSKQSQDRDG
ncbi:Hsp33 family molecular chaperone HslO [Mariprofundus ferrooxydans]|nr:Hsp33 family molecular chaperone HslO [Mariprofundus ferrooxydans]